MRSLARSLIIHEGISTTEAKAKELRPFIEKLVSTARIDSVANRRLVAARLGNDEEAVKKIFATLAPRYTSARRLYPHREARPERRELPARTRTSPSYNPVSRTTMTTRKTIAQKVSTQRTLQGVEPIEYTIDASGRTLGRVASDAAQALLGKKSPQYVKNFVFRSR